jgi:hypothetical protein
LPSHESITDLAWCDRPIWILNNKGGNEYMKIPIAMIAASFFIFTACTTVKTHWEQASQTNTMSAYEEFLHKYPQSEFDKEARLRIEKLSYEQAKKIDSLKEYQKYADSYPKGIYSEAAKKRMDEISYAAAKKENSLSGYGRYLREFPNGSFAGEAQAELDSLSFSHAKNINTVKAYQEYLAKYPNGAHAKNARIAIDHLENYYPLLKACLEGDAQTLERLLASGKSLSGNNNAAILLMVSLQRSTAKVAKSQDFLGKRKLVGISAEERAKWFATFSLLLRAGADPNAMRIKGYVPSSERRIPGSGLVRIDTGNPGSIVPADQGGLSALEFIELNKLDNFKKALMKSGNR